MDHATLYSDVTPVHTCRATVPPILALRLTAAPDLPSGAKTAARHDGNDNGDNNSNAHDGGDSGDNNSKTHDGNDNGDNNSNAHDGGDNGDNNSKAHSTNSTATVPAPQWVTLPPSPVAAPPTSHLPLLTSHLPPLWVTIPPRPPQEALMPSNVYPSKHPLVAHKLGLLRNVETKPKKFRELVREIAILLCYEATTDLQTEPITVTTPMGQTECRELKMGLGLVPVLRAGLGMVEGIWEMVPGAEVWHIGLKRDERTLQPMQYYANKPVAPQVQLCLLLDPMLATGGSAAATCTLLKSWGVTHIKYIGLLAAPEGIARLQAEHPDVDIHVGAIDSHLNDVGYIVPGLGDAGDRQFGTG